ncbi:MAG: VOC family protein [Actinomycetota bacterium]
MAARGFLSHVDLNVVDPSASIPFYDTLLGALGFERTGLDSPGRASWRLVDDGGAHFEIEVRPRPDGAAADRHRRSDPGLDHLAFHAESRGDVDAVFERLIEAGHEVDEPPRLYDYSPGYYAIGFDDPDGIRLEVVHDPATNP